MWATTPGSAASPARGGSNGLKERVARLFDKMAERDSVMEQQAREVADTRAYIDDGRQEAFRYTDAEVAKLKRATDAQVAVQAESTQQLQHQVNILKQQNLILQRSNEHLQHKFDQLQRQVQALTEDVHG